MKTTSTKKEFTHDQLIKALYFVFDLFSRANIPFFLTDDTAIQAKLGFQLSGDKVTVGIRYLDYQANSMSMLESVYLADKINKNELSYNYEGVPIIVEIIHDNDPMFTSTDTLMYQREWFHLPNPFDRYLERIKSI